MPINYNGEPVQVGNHVDLEMDLRKPCTYHKFLRKYRNIIGKRAGHNIPVIWSRTPDLVIVCLRVDKNNYVKFAIKQNDGYLNGFCSNSGQWWELVWRKDEKPRTTYFIFGARDLMLSVNYGDLIFKSKVQIDTCKFTRKALRSSVACIGTFTGNDKNGRPNPDKKGCESLLRCIIFICEEARFTPVEEVIYNGIRNDDSKSTLGELKAFMEEKKNVLRFSAQEQDLIHNWSIFSKYVLESDETGHSRGSPRKYLQVLGIIKG